MIMRIWHGVTKKVVGEVYSQYIQETGIPMYKAQEGNRGVYLLRRNQEDRSEFYLLSLWDSFESIEKFAGPNLAKAKYFDQDKDYLIELEPEVAHFEVIVGSE